MGKISRKMNRKKTFPLGAAYNNKRLTPEEYDRLSKDVMQTVVDKVVTDVLLVTLDILEHNWGKLHRRKTRPEKFGELFLPMLKTQSESHSLEYLELLQRAKLTNLYYG